MTTVSPIRLRKVLTEQQAEQRTARIAALLQARRSITWIATDLKLPNRSVREWIRRTPSLRALYDSLKRKDPKITPIGALSDVVRAQSTDFQAWVESSKPEGLTLSDFLVSIAFDAFEDEQERKFTA